ncbi:MAG: penicillin acylase family protein [Actinomycetota bacterium]
MRRRAILSLTAVIGLLVTGAIPASGQAQSGHYRDFGDPGGFLNIVPPGQEGTLSGPETLQAEAGEFPPHFKDQLNMYQDIVYSDATPGMTEAKLLKYFKDASFGVKPDDIDRVYAPGGRTDVTVIRDKSFGVPHIFGATREGTMFAQGYTGAEDRLFMMDVFRHVGRAELAAFLGPAPGNVAFDRDQMAAAPYTEADLTNQVKAIEARGPVGREVVADGTAYVAGVNAFISEALTDPSKLPAEYIALQVAPSQFIPEDIIAAASLVGGIFGKGGGREVQNYCALQKLAAQGALGSAAEARRVFDDFKFADDPEAPATAGGAFPYELDLGPVNPAAVPDLDCSALQAIAAPQPGPEQVVGAVVDLVSPLRRFRSREARMPAPLVPA